jgi:hypothetical protein
MKQKSEPDKAPAERVLKDIRRQTRRQYSAEEKIRIMLEGLRGVPIVPKPMNKEWPSSAFGPELGCHTVQRP